MFQSVNTKLKVQLKQIVFLAWRTISEKQVPLKHVPNAVGSVSPGSFPLLPLRLHNIKYMLWWLACASVQRFNNNNTLTFSQSTELTCLSDD